MALTRKSLKAMGLTEEQVDSIVEMHTETIDSLKDRLKTAEEKVEKLDGVEKELNELKAKSGDDYKSKYDKLKKDFDDYKADQTAKETRAAKEKAVRDYFESKKITGNNLAIAMRGAKDEIEAVTLGEDGNISDTKSLDELVAGEFAGLVVNTETKGVNTSTPPATTKVGNKMTKAEIMKITDAKERQKAIAENLSEFGY